MKKSIENLEAFKIDAAKLSLKETSLKYGVKECTVSKWKSKLGISIPKNVEMPSKSELEKNIEEYTNVELAEKYGVGLRLISKWRKKLGLTNVWKAHQWNKEKFIVDSMTMRWQEMCSKYSICRSDLNYWKKKYGVTTGKKEDRVVTYKEMKAGKMNGCWICTSHQPNDRGYPQGSGLRKRRAIGKVMWSKYNDSAWPENMHMLHLCDNPMCINPKHIVPGTQQENQKQMANRNRSPWGDRSGARKLSSEEAKKIYELKDSGKSPNEVKMKYGVSGSTIWHIWNDRTGVRDIEGIQNSDSFYTTGEKVK